MKLYNIYKQIVSEINDVELVWLTTFNLDPELVEKFLLPCIADKDPSEISTAEHYEALNVDLKDVDIKVWYDYRAMNFKNNKRTTIDFYPVNPSEVYQVDKTDAVFHPKVIFIKGITKAYLITGSANLSVAAWSSNRESIIVRKVEHQHNAREILSFFGLLGADIDKLSKWISSLKYGNSEWQFIYSLKNSFNLFAHIGKGDLYIWAPYFSKKIVKFLNALRTLGYGRITVIPNVTEVGKVHINKDELAILKTYHNICLRKSLSYDENQQMHHAKVWLSPDSLAIGSWNCSYRATGLGIEDHEKNIEAGVVLSSNPSVVRSFEKNLDALEFNDISGLDESEMDKSWEAALNPFSFSLEIVADWNNFKYRIEIIDAENEYTVSLPDAPRERIRLNNINGLSFRKNYNRVLKDKSFTVYDNSGKEIFQGYLREESKIRRPVYGYSSLSDLFDSLLEDPLGETPRKRCQYNLHSADEMQEEDIQPLFKYSGSESYYYMFVAFQKLQDKIETISNDRGKLDQLGFHLPGSIINIVQLVNESLEAALKENIQDDLLFHYFLVCEVNSCIKAFNNAYYGEEKIESISFTPIKRRLEFSKMDEKFLQKIRNDFNYADV
jgi:hypothetical protein